MRWVVRIFSPLLFLAMPIFFQNCAGVDFGSVPQAQSQSVPAVVDNSVETFEVSVAGVSEASDSDGRMSLSSSIGSVSSMTEASSDDGQVDMTAGFTSIVASF